ncbi:hypothetical protein Bca52824_035077 [Brassica carinata]|uniref:Uncharacterized protein n=1 Tax=Brassica carinata TaxID=52824 RepID=A0A8X7V072_BRACI|nr:hypothetical protein Bca52824_035077 [Brassica carinata]
MPLLVSASRAFVDCPLRDRSVSLTVFLLRLAVSDGVMVHFCFVASPSDGSQSGSDDQAEEVHIGSSSSAFPTRLFAAGAYPGKLRLNIYSKANVIGELTISFAITPEEERLLLLDEVEDTQVTSLLQKLLSGETFGVEDFPGGDTSFCPKVDSTHGADQCGEENPVPNPVRRRNLRPRKPVDVKIQDISSEEDSEPAVFPCSNGCNDEKMQAFLAQHEKISTQIKEMERNIRRDLAAASGGDRTAAVERPGVEKYPPKVALQQLWTVYPVSTVLIHREDDQQPQTPSTALITCRDPLCVQPGRMCYHQRYRLSSVMARRAAPQWHGRKQTRTVIGAPVDADERYDSCKEDISADTQMQETGADQLSEPEEDSKVGAGKRQQEIREADGVYGRS